MSSDEKTHAKWQTVKTGKADNSKYIENRFVEYSQEWQGTIRQAAWVNNCTVSEWRQRYARKYGKI